MKIAIYGGSFNPPHLGHVHLAEAVDAFLHPDLYYIIPSNIPPHKEQAHCTPKAVDRVAMCQLAFANIPNVIVSDMEMQRGGVSYTSDTLQEIHDVYPNAGLNFVLGSDMLFTLEEWHEFQKIFSLCRIIAVTRESHLKLAVQQSVARLREKYHADIIFLPFSPMKVSSTEIRTALANGEKPDLLSDNVYSYIQEKGLYQSL